MGNELQSLNERIAERIGKDLVDLIPPDQWQNLVDAEIAKFTQVTAPQIIKELMTEVYTNRAKSIISEITMTTEWDSVTNENIYKELEKFIGKSSGIILAGMLSPSMQMVLQDLRNRLNY